MKKVLMETLYRLILAKQYDLVPRWVSVIHSVKGVPVNAIIESGLTVLHVAAASGDVATLAAVLTLPGIDVNVRTDKGFSALHLAVVARNESIVTLLSKAPKINLDHSGSLGLTPLHLAAQSNQVDMINILVSNGSNVNITCDNGLTPLYIATDSGHVRAVNILLKVKNINPNQRCVKGFSPLDIAARRQIPELMASLLTYSDLSQMH